MGAGVFLKPQRIATTASALGLVLLVALAFAGGATAQGAPDNRGTVKIHDNATADPEERNEPHVSCDFWVQGFNMDDPTGSLTFYSWPPTSNKAEITPTGDTLDWIGTADGDGEYDFLKGAYYLPEGHYRLEVFTDDGHPSHGGHFAKAKMFWVDPCDEAPPLCVDDPATAVNDCDPPACVDDPQTAVDECDTSACVDDPATAADECGATEIPFFPGFTQLALGSLGALAAVGIALRRRS